MRTMLLASAAMLGMALATPALTPAFALDNAAAPSAARQPDPGLNASPTQLLQAAQQAVQHHRGPAAEAALSEAETRLLTRSVVPSQADTPDRSPAVQDIVGAREAVAHRDWAGADQHIAAAMQHAQMAESGGGEAIHPNQSMAAPPAAPGTAPMAAVAASNVSCASNPSSPACASQTSGPMTQGTSSIPLGGVLPPNGGLMEPNGGVMAPNVP